MKSNKKYLSSGNSKLQHTSKLHGVRIIDFSIPAYKSLSGKITCPFADECVKFCFAKKGAYVWSNTKQSLENKFELSKQSNFVELITNELNRMRRDKQIFVRLHSSGDFYNKAYVQKWIDIAKQNKGVKFYAYTKSILLFKNIDLPANLDITYSLGGKQDSLINLKHDRHAKIFSTLHELIHSGYHNASLGDLQSTKWYNENRAVGLVMH